ncbi:hypothetical protein [Azohydromonas aeria]|uniref:hypothetical protein n=1 Tax=Azohydromonas aeria TaxID=2590212 RepID=UPI0012F7747E|nr:hypothetical protein [Azohydromonas aeria]
MSDPAAIPAAITDALNNVAAFTTIMGFSLVGLLVAAGKVWQFVAGCWRDKADRAYFGVHHALYLELALKDGCHGPGSHTRLLHSIQQREVATKAVVALGLSQHLSALLQRLASGSTQLTLGDLLRDESLRLPLNYNGPQGNPFGISELNELLTFAESQATALAKACSPRFLLLAGAGWGKSLSCLWLSARDRDRARKSGGKWRLLVTVEDLAARGPAVRIDGQLDIGSQDWLVDAVCARAGLASISQLQRQILADHIARQAQIVVDGLDEFAERLGPARMNAFLASWVVENAALLTSRESYYEASLMSVPVLRKHTCIRLAETSAQDRLAFARAVCEHIHGPQAQQYFGPLQAALQQGGNVSQIAKTPICLMMLTEVAHLGAGPLYSVDIYATFANELAKRDAERLAGACTLEQVAKLQRMLAWEISKKMAAPGSTMAAVDLPDFRRTLQLATGLPHGQLDHVESVMLDSPLLKASRAVASDRDSLLVSFSHESFLEFQVSSLAVRWARGLEDDGEDFFEYLEAPGVSVFLKEFLDKLRRSLPLQQKVQQRLLSLMDRLEKKMTTAVNEGEGRIAAFALGQVAYYLGMLADEPTAERLAARLATEGDFWFRRCAAIGLAFGGRDAEVRRLIDEMFDQLVAGDFSLARKNIAVEMGFYGAQEFNRLDPTCESGSFDCQRIVTAIVREMSMEVEAPNWRMRLFNLFYLAFHRADSQCVVHAVLGSYARDTLTALNRHEAGADERMQQQIAQLRELVRPAAMAASKREATA